MYVELSFGALRSVDDSLGDGTGHGVADYGLLFGSCASAFRLNGPQALPIIDCKRLAENIASHTI